MFDRLTKLDTYIYAVGCFKAKTLGEVLITCQQDLGSQIVRVKTQNVLTSPVYSLPLKKRKKNG